jgi:ATP-dependent helicase/nuclease subunit A
MSGEVQQNASEAAYALNGQPCSREAFYTAACDPQRPIVVQACAGAGKTWMLVSRIVRALLAGAEPHEILAITFTKKAAGEMRERLQQWLHEFASADETQLQAELEMRGFSKKYLAENSRLPAANLRQLLSNLYQQSLQSGRPVQIRTFHSWFAALLGSAPIAVVEALGLPMPYELLEDDAQATTLVWPKFYELLQRDEALHRVYREAVADAGRWGVQEALTNALAKRVEFALADSAGVVDSSMASFGKSFPELAHLDEPLDKFIEEKSVLQLAAKRLGAAPQKSYAAKGAELEIALAELRWSDVFVCLLTKEGEPRKFSDNIEGVEAIRTAQELCREVQAACAQHAAWLHQQRMAQLSRALLECFADLKRSRGWVDMGDLERAAQHLLGDSALAGWVQQRLDARIKHLLIDEFQDTNPLQWQALQSWLSGYAGAGGGGGQAPSVFIVGDAKQSIYRFRRAEPQVFAAATRFVCEGLGGTLLACDHTRRNAQGITRVVNAVMAQAADSMATRDAAHPKGTPNGFDAYDFREHTTESSSAGQVIKLPLTPQPEKPPSAAALVWRDSLNQPRDEPEEHAVDMECAMAARWVAAQISGGLQASGIMILARQRDRLARMRDALRQLGIESQIAEKTALIEQPEVQDVVALLDALISPTNDLALARACKSPLLSWSDEALMALALHARESDKSWLEALLNNERSPQAKYGLHADLAEKTAQKLRQAQHLIKSLPPHDALSAIYDDWDVIERFMAASPAPLRRRVQLSLQALLQAALQASGGRFLTPHAWVRQLKSAALKAPQATADEQAVRLMTVHGAKGLEAHTVLLLDSNTPAKRAKSLDVLVDWPGESRVPQTFAFLRSEAHAPQCVAAALAHEVQQREREEINALYVAMTRARQQLVISGHEVRSPDPLCAWARFEALEQSMGDAVEQAWHGDFAVPVMGVQSHMAGPFYMKKLPVAVVDTPSSDIKKVIRPSASTVDDSAARIGQAMHRLLELYQPDPQLGVDLQTIAPTISAGFNLNAEQSAQALHAALTITQGEARWVWDRSVIDWQADEVELMHPDLLVPHRKILRIDRLVKHAATQTWWVLDYKSNPAPQHVPELTAQLQQYREAVQWANPQQSVKAAFITAQGLLVEI